MEFLAEEYANGVLDGRVVACRWVRLAVERHRRDLDCGHERGLWFDETAAMMVLAFFSVLRHSQGEWAGQPIILEPWQQFYLWTLFGWKRDDGSRRFRTSYLEVGRKNGKSTMLAGVGLYMLTADGEPGAQIYTAATKLRQAQIIHKESVRMVAQSPMLKKRLKVVNNNIHDERTFSKYEPLGRDSNTEDGLNVHGGLIDELHAHKTGEMWDVLDTATGSRRSPLMLAITTAGHDRQTICYQFHDYTEKILTQVLDNDAWHGLIFTLDRNPETGKLDDWEDEASWIKANPNLGVSKKITDLRDKAHKAKQMPARLNVFLQKELNIWTQAASRWIDPDVWRACNHRPVNAERLSGRKCWGGLDLSSRLDLTALVWLFEPENGRVDVFCRFWIPEDNIIERVHRDRVPYDVWLEQGYIEATPGDVVDYDFILARAREDGMQFDVQELAYDPWKATEVTNKLGLDNGAGTLVEFRQGFFSMNPAMMAFEVALKKKRFNHGGNPVLTWMADNLVAAKDPAGNLKPDKGASTEKIDGIVAMLMGYDRLVRHVGETESVYEERGILEI